MMTHNMKPIVILGMSANSVDSIFNFFEYISSFYIICFLVIMSVKKIKGNQSLMIILFSTVADSGNNNPWGNDQPPEWVILLSGICVTIFVGYCMQKVIISTWDYLYSDKEMKDDRLDSDQVDQFEQKEGTMDETGDEIVDETVAELEQRVLLLKKKMREQDFAEEVLYQIRRFNNGGRRPY